MFFACWSASVTTGVLGLSTTHHTAPYTLEYILTSLINESKLRPSKSQSFKNLPTVSGLSPDMSLLIGCEYIKLV